MAALYVMLTMTLRAALTWNFLLLFFSAVGGKAVLKEQKTITAEFGQNVTLPCRAQNNNIIVVEWSRADQEKEHVLLYRDEQFDPEDQHPSFKDRVDLQDRHMKGGDVSLVLKDVTINDAGTYECRVVQRRKNREKRANLKTEPISIIYLSVDPPPGQPGGTTGDGGKEDGSVGLIVGVPVAAVLLVAVAGFVAVGYRKCKGQKQDPYQPPADMDLPPAASLKCCLQQPV